MVMARHVGMGITDKKGSFSSSFYSHRFEKQEAQQVTKGHVIPYYTETNNRQESLPWFAQEGWVKQGKRVRVILNNFQGL